MHWRREGGQQDGVRDDSLDHRDGVDIEINFQQWVTDRGVVLAKDHFIQEGCDNGECELVEDEAEDDLMQMSQY